MLFLVFWISISLPVELCFFDWTEPSYFNVLNYGVMFAFILDLFFNMRCTYFDENKEITNSWDIAMHYICSRYFLIDFVSAIPYEFLFEENIFFESLTLVKFFKIFKMVRLLRLNRFSYIFKTETMR